MGNLREKPEKTKQTEVFRHKKLSYVVSSMIGWRVFMEDSILAQYPLSQNEDLGLFGIFDGHGGPQCSEFAMKQFEIVLLANENFAAEKYELALQQTFLRVDEMMKSKAGMKQLSKIRARHVQNGNAEQYGGNSLAGTTANVCLLTKDKIYVANVGDSRAIGIYRGSKSTKPKYEMLSKDHKPNMDTEKQRIIKAGGSINEEGRINNNLNLSRALGDFEYKKNPLLNPENQIISPMPDIKVVSRKQISHILMGCDGIWETKSGEQMAKWLLKKLETKQTTLKTIIQSLFNEECGTQSGQENGMDNMSAILLQI